MASMSTEQVAGGANRAATATGAYRRSATDQPQTSSAAGLYMRLGESKAPPQLSPHLCDDTVDLVLAEEDKIIVVGEIHRLEAFSLVVQVQGSRPNRVELRHILYAAFAEEMDNILDIQFMSKGCYHVEFTDEESVNKLLAIKEAGVEGAWISFHKWSHNVKVDDILQDQEASMVFSAVFPGLRKEWRNVLPRIGALLGKVIATRNGQAVESNRGGGVPAVRLIAPRNVRLPAMIALPNLINNKPPVMQKVYYQGLPDQCFVCRQFGHLGRDCQKRRPNVEAHRPNQPMVNNDGWSTVSAKHVFKPSNTVINPVLLLEDNPFHSLQEVEKDVSHDKMDSGLSPALFLKEHHVAQKSKDILSQVQHRVAQDSKDILAQVQSLEAVNKSNNQLNKGKQHVGDNVQQSDKTLSPIDFQQSDVGKLNISDVDMNCEAIVAFTGADRSSDRVHMVDKHMPVRSHKLIGKDIWSNRRQLRASEDGRKGRDVALAERRIGGKNNE